MNGTLYASGLLNTSIGFMMSGLIGVLFGVFLEQAGFGSSRRITGVFYFKDMTVLKVILTALAVAIIGYHYLVSLGWLVPGQVHMLETYWLAQIVGGLIFGVGFVMGGWCPGTALVGLASAKLDALLFIVGVVLGSILFNEVFSVIRPVYEGMQGGAVFLYESLNASPKLLPLMVCVVSVLAFAGSTLLERRVGGKARSERAVLKRHGVAAAALLLFSAGVLLTHAPTPVTAVEKETRQGFMVEVAEAKDHVEPLELAELIMKGNGDLLVVDLRSQEDYTHFHLRGAINVPLETLGIQADAELPRDREIVLYSNGTTHASQAWLQLRHWGWTDVRILTDGLLGFWRVCLTPPSLSGLLDEQTGKAHYAAFQARKSYFLQDTES
jgi:thiosulfate/3-mercaptopyruvate sulfurtransferase